MLYLICIIHSSWYIYINNTYYIYYIYIYICKRIHTHSTYANALEIVAGTQSGYQVYVTVPISADEIRHLWHGRDLRNLCDAFTWNRKRLVM